MTGTIELSQYVIDAIANAVVKKMQEPCEDCVSRKEVEKLVYRFLQKSTDENSAFYEHLLDLPPVTPQPKTGRCKNCKYFEYDSLVKVDGVIFIVAHENCKKWGGGCKTREDGYCFMFEPKESEET